MKKLVCSVALSICVPIYAMENAFAPPFEAVCVNEIVSGIRQKREGGSADLQVVQRLSEDDIAQRKRLLRVMRRSNNNSHNGCVIDRKSTVIMYYLTVDTVHDSIQILSQSTESAHPCFTARLTPEQVVTFWDKHTVDEARIPNKNWKQDLEEVKKILGLSTFSATQ